MEVAEKLIGMFPELPTATVVQVVADCAGEYPADDPLFVEQAATARLQERRQVMADLDALDVSLDHPELRAEVELTSLLMIAANESRGRLSQAEIDSLLNSVRH